MSVWQELRMLRAGWRDVLEIGIVSYAFYRVLLLLHRTRAMQILFGIVIVVVAYAIAQLLKLAMIVTILTYVSIISPLAMVVVFAPEIRAMFAQLGRSPMTRFFSHMGPTEVAAQIAEAVEHLARAGVGAIIAVERETRLDDYIQTGSQIQAKVSADLLSTIFTPYSPLHDGAVIIRGDTIVAASAILPLSQTAIEDRTLGTRHRASLGLSELTDAIVIAVSEETSTITVAVAGQLWRNFTAPQVRDLLTGRPPRRAGEPVGMSASS